MIGERKFCPACGTANSFDSRFCTSCGTKFPDFTPPSTEVHPPTFAQADPKPVEPDDTQPIKRVVPPSAPAPSNFITLSCPNCGGKLQITPDIDRFACQYCGYEHIVRRSGGTVSLEPVMQMMGQLNTNLDRVGSNVDRISGHAERQASEAAIVRIKQEIADTQKRIADTGDFYKWGWMLILLGVFSSAGFKIAGAAIGGKLFDYISGFFFFLTLLFILIVVIGSIEQKKVINGLHETLRQKEEELKRHQQLVSQPNPFEH